MKSLSSGLAVVGIALAAIMLGACERPFVEPQRPTLEIVEPDLETVVFDDSITLIVRAEALRSVETVTVDGRAFTYDEDEQVWIVNVSLSEGLNRLILSATDSDGLTTEDSVYAFHAVLDVSHSPRILPEPRGGHTASLLPDGSVFILGGSPRFGDPSRVDAVVLSRDGSSFAPVADHMSHGRSGHTATLLPDGRVLIVGGSRNGTVRSIDDLVEEVEIFDPENQRFSIVPVSGAPIRRAYHTAIPRIGEGDIVIDLFGGQGDIQYTPSPQLGRRNDVRSFLFRNDSLIAQSPAPGPNLGFRFAGHTQTPLDTNRMMRTLIAGASPGEESLVDFSSIIDYDSPVGLNPRETGSMQLPRMHHAAAMLRQGEILIFGGHQGGPATSIAEAEIYSEEAERFFQFTQSHLERRFGLSATILSDNRILLLGGFTPGGSGVALLEIVDVSTP